LFFLIDEMTRMAGKIFINYRRGDDSGFVQALLSRLEQAFSREQLFIDIDGIEPGLDFVRVLEEQVAQCDVLLAVIGKGWIDARDETNARRLDNPEDFVRIEIASALGQDKRVIPVLVGDARMPRSDELPDILKPLTKRGAVRLTHERFRADTTGFIGALQTALEKVELPRRAHETARDSGTENGTRAAPAEGNRTKEASRSNVGTSVVERAFSASASRVRRHLRRLTAAFLGIFLTSTLIWLLWSARNLGTLEFNAPPVDKAELSNPGFELGKKEIEKNTPAPGAFKSASDKPTVPSTSSLMTTADTTKPVVDPSKLAFGVGTVEASAYYKDMQIFVCTIDLVMMRNQSGTSLFFGGKGGEGLNLISWEIPSTDPVIGVHIHDRREEVENRLGTPNQRLVSPNAAIYVRNGASFRFDYDGLNAVRKIWKSRDRALVESAVPPTSGCD
jgi:hypothetical protein